MIARWVKFTGSEDQISEILNAKDGVIFEYVIGEDHVIFYPDKDRYHIQNRIETKAIAQYMLCNPHPHVEMIIEWARTGREVYFDGLLGKYEKCLGAPSWRHDVKYSFNPDGDGK